MTMFIEFAELSTESLTIEQLDICLGKELDLEDLADLKCIIE
jgi:hypothetical protein